MTEEYDMTNEEVNGDMNNPKPVASYDEAQEDALNMFEGRQDWACRSLLGDF